MRKYKLAGLFIFISISLSACAMQTGLKKYTKSEEYSTGPLQVVLDCSISTFYEEDDAKKTGFSENYNNAVCEAFAEEVKDFVTTEEIGEVLEPVTITLGAQFGGDIKTTKIFVDERSGRLDGEIKLPKSQGKTIAYNTLPQGNLPHLIMKLTNEEPYKRAMSNVRYMGAPLGLDFNQDVRNLPVATQFPLVRGIPILLLNINGQKLTDSLQTQAKVRGLVQGVGTAVISGLLTGGSYIVSARQRGASVVAVNAVLVDESGDIVWTRTSGGQLGEDLPRTASSIFYNIKRQVIANP